MSKLFVDSVLVKVQSPTVQMYNNIPQSITESEANSILRVEKTDNFGAVDTYTIFLTNGNTFEYNVTNGTI
jgi:hypothetical protein